MLWKAPDPAYAAVAPKSLKEAVWYPFLGFLSVTGALEILAFVLLYKLADNLVQALQRPFLIDKGYSDFDRGFVLFVIGLVVNVVGTFIGGILTRPLGLGQRVVGVRLHPDLRQRGLCHPRSPAGAEPANDVGPAFSFETLASSLASGAFLVLLMRMTQKRFSADAICPVLQPLRAAAHRLRADLRLPRPCHRLEAFFWSTLPTGIPGLILLARFVPFTAREPEFKVEPPRLREPLTGGTLALKGFFGGVVGLAFGAFTVALMSALEAAKKGGGFDLATPLPGARVAARQRRVGSLCWASRSSAPSAAC